MKYHNIKEKLKKLFIFSPQDIYLIDPAFRLPTLYDWEAKGLVVKLRNNNYVFSDFTPMDKDFYFIANKLYEPSYVSLESALEHYSVIPEVVQEITSITTNKTNKFETPFGNFSYSSLDEGLFFGYNSLEFKSTHVQMASLEKTILDYLYLNSPIDSVPDFESLRWNKDILIKNINFTTFDKYLVIFDNKALAKRCTYFMEYLDA